MKHYDDYASFKLTLPVIPREMETFRFDFIKGKIGTSNFWVEGIVYEICNNAVEVSISLKSGWPNKYREFLLSKAIFKNEIGLQEIHHSYDFQIDEKLKQFYRS